MAGATLQPILDRLNSVPQYHPGNADTFADWTLEAGDIVRLKRMGENYDSPVMVNTMRWNGQAKSTLEFDGQKERKAISKVSKQKFGGGGGGIQNSKDLYTLSQNFDELNGDFTQYVVGPDGLIHSGLWQGRESIAAVAGEFDLVEDPTTHVKTMVVKSGGGIKIRRDNVEYGLYDNGNLTAGIIVSKINGGTTRILGKNVVIDGDTTINGSAIASSLEGEDISCSNLSVGVKLTATNASVTGGMDVGYLEAGTVEADSVEVNGRSVNIVDASVNTSTNTLTITKADGTTINFRKAAGDQYDQVKTLTLDGTVSSSKKMVAKVTVESSTSGATFDMPDKVVDVSVPYGAGFDAVVIDKHKLYTPTITGKGSSVSITMNTGAHATNMEDDEYAIAEWKNTPAPLKAIYDAGWGAVSAFKNNTFPYGTWSIESGSGASANVAFKVSGAVLENDVTLGDLTWRNQPTNIYRTAYSAGTADCVGTLSGAWSKNTQNSAKCTINSNPAAETPFVQYVSHGTWSWEDNVATSNLLHSDNGSSYYTTGATIVCDASARYNAGYSAGRTFEDTKIAGSWNDTHTSSDATYTVSSPLSDSLFTSKVYLTQGEWGSGMKYIYLRSGSTSGTSRARLTVNMPTTATWTKTQTQTLLTAECTVGGKTYTHEFDI